MKKEKTEREKPIEYVVWSGEDGTNIFANHYAYDNNMILNLYLTNPLELVATFKNWDWIATAEGPISSSGKP